MRKKTQVGIKKEIENIQKQISFLSDYWNAPGYAPAIEKAQEYRRKWEMSNKDTLESLRNSLREAKQELEALKSKNELMVPDDIAKWFKSYINGIDWGGSTKPRIKWISDDKRYVIVTCPGGIGGTGTCMGRHNYYYVPAKHWVAKVNDGGYFQNNLKEVEGRLTKEKMTELQHFANRWATKL